MIVSDTLATTVVTAVADRTDTPATELPTLYDSVDMDAIRSLLEHAADRPDTDVRVAFEYAGCRVVVDADGVAVADGASVADDDRRGVEPNPGGSGSAVGG